MVPGVGFEPTASGSTIQRSNQLSYPGINLYGTAQPLRRVSIGTRLLEELDGVPRVPCVFFTVESLGAPS